MLHYADAFIDSLILEDCPYEDLTTDILGIGDKEGILRCYPRAASCILSGARLTSCIFERLGCQVSLFQKEGALLQDRPVILEARGAASSLHKGWKIAQNCMEYMTGIATRTARIVTEARAGNPLATVAVTRKNFPGTKRMSLDAALAGGAAIHRVGLSESVLVFEQHEVFLDQKDVHDGLSRLLPELRKKAPEKNITIEATSPEEAVLLAEAGFTGIQLDKFSPEQLEATVGAIRKRAKFNPVTILAAGGISADNARAIAATGVDVLVTSWVYWGKPQDIRVTMEPV